MAPGGESGRCLGRFGDIRYLAETGSTNADVTAWARAGAPEGVVVVTDHQRAGRGRRGRVWTAPPGSALLASVLARPRLAPSGAALVGLAAGVAAVEACAEMAGVTPSLKWPNDVVVESPEENGGAAKLAGLLAESLVEGGELRAVVIGMGCNLRRAGVEEHASSLVPAYLEDLAGRPVDRDHLLHAWLARLDHWCSTLEAPEGQQAVVEDYRRRCATLGRRIRVQLAGGTAVEGVAEDVTALGHLLVVGGDGRRREIAAGDVVHLRPRS